jgi:fimbrial chaperone protein
MPHFIAIIPGLLRWNCRRRLPALWLTVLIFSLLPSLAHASSFNVSPVKLTLQARAKSTSVTVSNTGNRPLVLRLNLYSWSKRAGADQLEPAQDLLVSPPIIKLAAGTSQIVRIGRPAEIPVPEVEQSYRLLVTELAIPDEKQRAGGGLVLRSLLEISVPLFVPPANASKQLDWRLVAGTHSAQLSVTNAGTVHSQITRIRLLDATGAVVAESSKLFYALPRQQSVPVLAYTRQPRVGETLRLEYTADNAARTAELKASGS